MVAFSMLQNLSTLFYTFKSIILKLEVTLPITVLMYKEYSHYGTLAIFFQFIQERRSHFQNAESNFHRELFRDKFFLSLMYTSSLLNHLFLVHSTKVYRLYFQHCFRCYSDKQDENTRVFSIIYFTV